MRWMYFCVFSKFGECLYRSNRLTPEWGRKELSSPSIHFSWINVRGIAKKWPFTGILFCVSSTQAHSPGKTVVCISGRLPCLQNLRLICFCFHAQKKHMAMSEKNLLGRGVMNRLFFYFLLFVFLIHL